LFKEINDVMGNSHIRKFNRHSESDHTKVYADIFNVSYNYLTSAGSPNAHFMSRTPVGNLTDEVVVPN
jgi:hypothetical protein